MLRKPCVLVMLAGQNKMKRRLTQESRPFKVSSPVLQQLHEVVALPGVELRDLFPVGQQVLHLTIRGSRQEHGVVCTGRQQQFGLKGYSKYAGSKRWPFVRGAFGVPAGDWKGLHWQAAGV